MPYVHKYIPDRLPPPLPTTTSGVAQQGTCENHTTARLSEYKRRKRGGRQVKRQRKLWKGKRTLMRVGAVNIETITERGRELADMMKQRNVDILYLQKTK